MPAGRQGFTLPEIIVAVSFFGILLAIVTINLLGARKQVAQGANIDILIADLKSQQAAAMSGEGAMSGEEGLDYGVFLEADKYTLFNGGTYTPGVTTNFTVNLDPAVAITNITFPNSVVIFTKGAGETTAGSFNLGAKTITINKYGVVMVQ